MQPAAQQRFAAGEADLGDPQVDEKPDDAQIFVDGEVGVLGAVLAGAAVDALVIAAVGDGDAQIVNHPAVAVGEPGGAHFRNRRGEGSCHRHFQAIPFWPRRA